MRLIKKIAATLLCLMFFASAAMGYTLTLDTTSWESGNAIVAYDLIDGSPSASIVNLGVPQVDGVEKGTTNSLTDDVFYNTIEQSITLGRRLDLDFSLGRGSIPAPGYFPDSFAVSLLNSSQLPLFHTADPTGADTLLQWDIGAGEPTAFIGELSGTIPVSVPEPPTLILFILGLFVCCLLRMRKNIPFIIAGLLVANMSSALGAQSLAKSTDLGSQTKLMVSGLRLNRRTHTFDSALTIRNTSQTRLNPPYSVAVLSLPDGVVLTNATVVSDEGVPLITVRSGSFIAPGDTKSLTLKFVNRTHRAFPISLRLVRLEQPIPQLAELQGPDANGNGVRDDLEPILDTRYDNGPERHAAILILKRMRNGLGATQSVETAFNAVVSLNKSFDCMYSVVGLDQGAIETEFLRDQMMNTRERVSAWISLTNKVAGQSVPIGTSNPCEVQ